jgi:hypothetical protein
VGDHCGHGVLHAANFLVLGVGTVMQAISPITTTSCPQEIRAANRKAEHEEWWNDPVYQAIAAKRIEGETCHYCGQRPATLAHHDEDWMYLTKEAYYDPHNMTPCCGPCHKHYRRGLVICPACRKHYIRRTSEKCQWCRGTKYICVSHTGRAYKSSYRRRHPCGKNLGQQRCTEKMVCPYSPRKAPDGCRAFVARKKEVS